jgi:hypothetical protein
VTYASGIASASGSQLTVNGAAVTVNASAVSMPSLVLDYQTSEAKTFKVAVQARLPSPDSIWASWFGRQTWRFVLCLRDGCQNRGLGKRPSTKFMSFCDGTLPRQDLDFFSAFSTPPSGP